MKAEAMWTSALNHPLNHIFISEPKAGKSSNVAERLLVYGGTNLKIQLCEDGVHKTDLFFYMR